MTGRVDGDSGLEVALRRVVVGYRIVGVVWLWLLAGVTVATEPQAHGALIAATGALATAWTAATLWLAARSPQRLTSPVWLAADVLVSGGVIVLASAAAARGFFGGYPFSTVVLGGYAAGYRGGLGSAIVLSIVTFVSRDGGEAISSSLVFVVGAGVVTWGIAVISRYERQRRELEARLSREEAERARSQERADTAAALHDSVLQTLALIQRRSDDPAAVASLARQQERDLREWLSGDRRSLGARGGGTLAAAVKDAVEDVEERYPITVDVVVVGDASCAGAGEALVAATREALVNVAKHAQTARASLYLEVGGGQAAVFVRDRGVGFDPAAVPADRRGIVESIVGRLERHGGAATVRSTPGDGTEVELRAPLPA